MTTSNALARGGLTVAARSHQVETNQGIPTSAITASSRRIRFRELGQSSWRVSKTIRWSIGLLGNRAVSGRSSPAGLTAPDATMMQIWGQRSPTYLASAIPSMSPGIWISATSNGGFQELERLVGGRGFENMVTRLRDDVGSVRARRKQRVLVAMPRFLYPCPVKFGACVPLSAVIIVARYPVVFGRSRPIEREIVIAAILILK
jgi:hypothetical protein